MDTFFKTLFALAFATVALGLVVIFWGWVIMLLWGAIAGALGYSTIGFGTACLIGLALAIVGSFFK